MITITKHTPPLVILLMVLAGTAYADNHDTGEPLPICGEEEAPVCRLVEE